MTPRTTSAPTSSSESTCGPTLERLRRPGGPLGRLGAAQANREGERVEPERNDAQHADAVGQAGVLEQATGDGAEQVRAVGGGRRRRARERRGEDQPREEE